MRYRRWFWILAVLLAAALFAALQEWQTGSSLTSSHVPPYSPLAQRP